MTVSPPGALGSFFRAWRWEDCLSVWTAGELTELSFCFQAPPALGSKSLMSSFLFWEAEKRGCSLKHSPLLPLWLEPRLVTYQGRLSLPETSVWRAVGHVPSCLLFPFVFLTSLLASLIHSTNDCWAPTEPQGKKWETALVLEELVSLLTLNLTLSNFKHFFKVTVIDNVLLAEREGYKLWDKSPLRNTK